MRVCGATVLNNVIFDNRLFVHQRSLFNDTRNFINSLLPLVFIVPINYSRHIKFFVNVRKSNFLRDTYVTNHYELIIALLNLFLPLTYKYREPKFLSSHFLFQLDLSLMHEGLIVAVAFDRERALII